LKKIYGKPDIYFDNFAMSTAIAGNCSTVTNTPYSGECGLKYTDTITIFTGDITQCNVKVGTGTVDAEWNGICYHVPTGNIDTTVNTPGGLFNS
jgi:hypothetical protein